jgi:hypothetical protein
MATYRRADAELTDLLTNLLQSYHPDLIENGVTIDLLWAYGEHDELTGDVKSPAIVHNGYPAHGLCRVMGLKDRAAGRADAEILLDHDFWETVNPRTRAALLDHELEHLILRNERDDIGRPKLKLRKHDVQCGWFRSVAERHGSHSIERIQAKMVYDGSGQSFWPDLFTVAAGTAEAL